VALSASDVRATWRALLESDPSLGNAFTKTQMAAAVTATDEWMERMEPTFTAALPKEFQAATVKQRALLRAHVAIRRAGM